jgi:trans-aconitate 2-methyltransferase
MTTPLNPWNAALYEDKHSFVWKHGASLVALLAPQAGERILDLGCGTGHLTAQIAEAAGHVIGIDSSPAMIEQARRTYPGLQFEVADARSFRFPIAFDAVFSNAVLHWIKEAEQVVHCVHQALKPGGRFVVEFGGHGNVRAIATALRHAAEASRCDPFDLPWYFPSIGEYAALLERGGLEVTSAVLFDRPTPLEGEQGMRDWITMFAGQVLGRVAAGGREEFLDRIEAELRPVLYRDGTWFADYRRLRVVACRAQG